MSKSEIAKVAETNTPAEEANMADKPSLVKPIIEAGPPPDPFDLTNFRLDQSFVESAGVKKLLTTVPVHKPNPQDYIRVHPSPEYRRNHRIERRSRNLPSAAVDRTRAAGRIHDGDDLRCNQSAGRGVPLAGSVASPRW